MKISDSLNNANNKDNAKNIIGKIAKYVLAFTIFLPFTIYYILKDKYGEKIRQKQYNRIIQNKEKYKEKALKEIIGYMVKKDIPNTVNAKRKSGEYVTREYLIYKDKRYDEGDIFGDFHLKDFISFRSCGGRKTYNKKSIKYYNACEYYKQDIEYDWVMNEIEKYFRQFEDMEVERGFHKEWGKEYEYILLKVKN